eukprot:4549166-Amphidinium_carterae.1
MFVQLSKCRSVICDGLRSHICEDSADGSDLDLEEAEDSYCWHQEPALHRNGTMVVREVDALHVIDYKYVLMFLETVTNIEVELMQWSRLLVLRGIVKVHEAQLKEWMMEVPLRRRYEPRRP